MQGHIKRYLGHATFSAVVLVLASPSAFARGAAVKAQEVVTHTNQDGPINSHTNQDRPTPRADDGRRNGDPGWIPLNNDPPRRRTPPDVRLHGGLPGWFDSGVLTLADEVDLVSPVRPIPLLVDALGTGADRLIPGLMGPAIDVDLLLVDSRAFGLGPSSPSGAIPAPGTLALLGLAGLALSRRRRRA